MSERITVLYFAWIKERAGTGEESVELPDGVCDVAGLMEMLGARHAGAFDPAAQVRAAVNQVFARPDTPVRAGDEVAFFPPVTGG
jgi:molybdopterin synthase sulfur carrier subunit